MSEMSNNKSYYLAMFGVFVRYYDYALFGLSAGMLSKNFMPGQSDTEQLINFFTVFAITVLVRPIGSVIFSQIGDNIGRVKAIKLGILCGAIATSIIAFIPSYNMIGNIATLIVILSRMLFMITLSAESDGIRIYISEKIDPKKRYLGTGLVSFFSQIGSFFAALMYNLSNKIDILPNLWRVNFLIGGILGIILLYFRSHLKENELFLKSKKNQTASNKLLDIIKQNLKFFIISVILQGCVGGMYNFFIIFLTVSVTKSDIPVNTATSAILIFLYSISTLISGYIADIINTNKQILYSTICTIILLISFQLFINIDKIQILHIMLVILIPFYTIPMHIKCQSLFVTKVRMRMCSISHSIGSVLLSSTTPLICSKILHFTNSLKVIFVIPLILISLITISYMFIFNSKHIENFEH